MSLRRMGMLALGAALVLGCMSTRMSSDGLSEGKPAPNISGMDVNGERFALNDYRGKVVLLDFWASW